MSTSGRNRSIFKPQNTDASSSIASATLRLASLARRKKEEKLAAQKQNLTGNENVAPAVPDAVPSLAVAAISDSSKDILQIIHSPVPSKSEFDIADHVESACASSSCAIAESSQDCASNTLPSFTVLPSIVSYGVDAWVSSRMDAVVHGVTSALDSARAFITGGNDDLQSSDTLMRNSTSPMISISQEAQAEIEKCSQTLKGDGTVIVDPRKRRRTFIVDSQPFDSFKSPDERSKFRPEVMRLKEELELATEKFLEEERNHEVTCAKLNSAEDNITRLRHELQEAEGLAAVARREVEEHSVMMTACTEEVQSLKRQIVELNEQVAMIPVMEQELMKTNEMLDLERKRRKEDQEEIAQVPILRRQVAELQATLLVDSDIRRKLHNQLQELRGNVRVMVRIRPALEKEGASESKILLGKNSLTGNPKSAVKISKHQDDPKGKEMPSYTFDFDRVFAKDEDQASIFSEISKLVQSALDGYKVCIFAYGQTGSGKTHTMMGSEGGVGCEGDTSGVIPRSIRQVFSSCSSLESQGWSFNLVACFLEIYNDVLRDLLAPQSSKLKKDDEKLDIHHENGDTVVKNLTYVPVSSAEQLLVQISTIGTVFTPLMCCPQDLVKRSIAGRTVAATVRNDTSSRSHSIFQVAIPA
jgi:kinesin family protein C1